MNAHAPIGIFDSGTGGLTVARAVKELLPKEDLIYFGDTAHLPYGDKSTATIQSYSVKITDQLLQRGCKVILIACNSASAAAYELIKAYVGSKALVVNVIDPVVDYLKEGAFTDQVVGLIGTLQTINSRVFEQQLNSAGIALKALATPLLAPMIEEGFIHDRISHEVIDNYLSHECLHGITSLVLGCTHYPIIKNELQEYYQGRVQILDSASIVAKHLQLTLSDSDLLKTEKASKDQFLVSDLTPSFEQTASFFFNQKVELERCRLWE